MGKPQAGRHTTAAVYLLNVGFERLSALFIETRFSRTNRRRRGRAGDTTRGKKFQGEAVDQPSPGDPPVRETFTAIQQKHLLKTKSSASSQRAPSMYDFVVSVVQQESTNPPVSVSQRFIYTPV